MQKATSNAGSPMQAVSASRNTGPCGPDRMFLGLMSPCISAIRAAAMRAASSRIACATNGCRSAVNSR